MHRKIFFAVAALAALGFGQSSRADMRAFTFSTTPVVPAGGIDPQPTTTVTYTGNAGSSVTPTDIKVGTIDLTPPSGPGPILSPFTFDILITDTGNGFSGTFSLSGLIFGSVDASSSSLNFVFAGGSSKFLGDENYTVIAKFIDVPTVEAGGITRQGSITAAVSTANRSIPEPASLALFGLGGVGLLVVARRRKRA